MLFVPVDGGFTLNISDMQEVISQIAAPLVVPMHYFSPSTLGRFIELIEDSYQPIYSDTPTVTLASLKLPYHKILVLPGG